MLESFRKGQRWLTLLFVATIGLVFVFFFGSGGGGIGPAGPTGDAIVALDDVQLTSYDFRREQRATETRLRQQLGDAYDQLDGDRYVDSQALSTMVNSVVLAAAAEDLGLHVTTDEVRRVVQTSPAFIDDEGRFSPRAFNNFAESEYGTQRAFIRSFTRSLLAQKLVQVLAAQTTLSDAEVDLMTRYELDEVRIAYAALDPTRLPEGESLTDDEVAAWAEAREDELRATFDERAASLATPEQVRARHILVLAPSDAAGEELEAARSRAQAARDRIEAGEDFGAVAGEVSDDVSTAASGGDLGFFERGSNDPAVDDAAFSLELGALSEPVRSEYGFHVIQVEERREAAEARWEDLRLELAREAATAERAQTRALERATVLAEAIEGGQSLEDAAREAGLSLERPPGLKRRPDGFVPGLGAAEDLLTAAFSLEAGQSSPRIFQVNDQRVLIQVLERDIASEAEVASARAERRAALVEQERNRVIDQWLSDTRRQLEASGRLRVNAELALGSS